MMATEIKVSTDLGPEWTMIDPRDLPVDIDISYDIESATDRGRAERIARADRVLAALYGSPQVIDQVKTLEWYLEENDVRRPMQFFAPGIPGPQNVQGVQGQPGTEGVSAAPVGTPENAQANQDFTDFSPDNAAAENATGETAVGV